MLTILYANTTGPRFINWLSELEDKRQWGGLCFIFSHFETGNAAGRLQIMWPQSRSCLHARAFMLAGRYMKLVMDSRQSVVKCMVFGSTNYYLFESGVRWIDNVIELNWNDSTWNF